LDNNQILASSKTFDLIRLWVDVLALADGLDYSWWVKQTQKVIRQLFK